VKWATAWQLAKDILLTGTGLTLIVSQIFSRHPDGLLLGTGLALTVPSVADHVRALLPSSGDGESSPRSYAEIPPPSSSGSEGTGERPGAG